MFTITTISFNNSSNLELEITLEPKNRINSKCKAAMTDLKRRLTSTFGNLSRQGHNSNDVEGLVFKDFTSIRPANISADKIADYPDKIFSVINHEKFQLKYVVLQGAISSADMELFLKLIMVELKNNITIEKIILRNIADINSLATLKDINFQGQIKLCIEYNEETALKQVKNILSRKENIEYILLPKITFIESNQATISTHKSHENDEINSNFSNHSSHNKSYYVSSDSADGNSTDDENYNQLHKVEAQESITNNNTIGITQGTINQNLKIIENNINQPNRLNLELTSPEVRMSIIKKQLNELEPEIENLQTQIKDLRDINIKLEQQNEELKLQDKALKEENKKLKQTEVYAALVLPNSNASLDKKLFDQLIMQAAAADTWRQENGMLQVNNVSLKAENDELQANNKSLKDENSKLTLEVGYLQDQNNKRSENIEILRTDNVSMLAVVKSLKAKEKELDVSHAETRNLKTQIEVLSELLRREQDKIFNLNSLSYNSNYSVNNTFPLSSPSVNSSAHIGYNKAITNVASQPNISNQGMQKKRSFEMLGTDLLVQPPSPKAQKLTSTSSPRYNNSQDSPFWSSPANLPVDKKTYSTTKQQPAQYSPNATQKKDIEITLRPPQVHQQTLISAGADKYASAHKPQGFYYTPELESREHRPVGYVLPRSSAQEANNNTRASDISSLINSVFNKQK